MAILEAYVGVPDASAVYLIAVVITAVVAGTLGAIVAAVGSFLLYNFLFTEPLYTFTIADPGVLLSVVLLLFVGIVVGQARSASAIAGSASAIAGGDARAHEREAAPCSS